MRPIRLQLILPERRRLTLLTINGFALRSKTPKGFMVMAKCRLTCPVPPATTPMTPTKTPQDPPPNVNVVERTTTTATVESEDQVSTQSDDALSETNKNVTNHQFFVSDSEPECSESDNSQTYISNKFVSDLKDKQWVCFKAENSQGVPSYSKVQVNLPPSEPESVDPSVEQEKPVKSNNNPNDFSWGLIILIIVIAVVGGSYWFRAGTKLKRR